MTLQAVTDEFVAVLERMAGQSSIGLLRMWDSLGSWTEADADVFADMARPFISAMAQGTLDATVAYAQQLTPEVGALSELIVDDAAARVFDPFDRLGSLLSDGIEWGKAVDNARSAAKALGHDTVYRTTRHSLADLVRNEGPWMRRVTGKSCDWCLGFSGYEWPTASWATFGHEHCDCIAVPASAAADHNAGIRSSSGYDERAKASTQKIDARRQRAALERSVKTAKARSLRSGIDSVREPDRARRLRLEQREQDWAIRAARAQERLDILLAA